ncbi:MAG: SPFH domain-containing protein [Clostridia bacterium]|nr:SPFH domain-containing protein [Clostridia bacterium]
MGLISAAIGSASGVLSDAWKDYFYCEAIPNDVLVLKGKKKGGKHGADNIITDGSVIAVADGQCMIIVEQGKVVDICAEPGEYKYDNSTEPSVFSGDLGEGIKATLMSMGKRFTFGGIAANDQRIYYFNTKEIMGNKYGTANAVPFRVVDANIGLDMDISIKCFGEYSYRITNPILFYTNVCGNVQSEYKKTEIDSMLKTELLTALQPAFAKISDMGIRYSSLPGHTYELSNTLNEVLSDKWANLRGIEIVSFGVNSVKADEEDERMIKELQRNATFRDPTMAAAHLVGAQANAMQDAAKNSAGAAVGFMGMNMAGGAGMNPQNLYQMGAQQAQVQQAQPQMPKQNAVSGWTCPSCGAQASGKFCPECGTKKPEADGGWACPGCGTMNTGRFCQECGTKKPAGVPQYKCDKCGWVPEDPKNPPRFCPECGDPFGDEDIV